MQGLKMAFYSYFPLQVHMKSVLLSIGVLVGLYLSVLFCKRKKQLSTPLLGAYITFIFCLTVLERPVSLEHQIQMELLWSYRMALKQREFVYVFGDLVNTIMFIPIGFLQHAALPKTSSKKMRFFRGIIMGLIVSIFIEILQLVFMRGLFEIDDIFHNVLGTILGYAFYLLFNKIRNGVKKME